MFKNDQRENGWSSKRSHSSISSHELKGSAASNQSMLGSSTSGAGRPGFYLKQKRPAMQTMDFQNLTQVHLPRLYSQVMEGPELGKRRGRRKR